MPFLTAGQEKNQTQSYGPAQLSTGVDTSIRLSSPIWLYCSIERFDKNRYATATRD